VNRVQNLFFRFFLNFLTSNGKKQSNLHSNGRIHIQTIKFEFKWTNQELTTQYRPPAPVAGDSVGATARPGSSADGTAQSGQTSTSPSTGGSAQQSGATASGAGGCATH
jgi:hypothetical protein